MWKQHFIWTCCAFEYSQQTLAKLWSERKFSIYFRMISDLCPLALNCSFYNNGIGALKSRRNRILDSNSYQIGRWMQDVGNWTEKLIVYLWCDTSFFSLFLSLLPVLPVSRGMNDNRYTQTAKFGMQTRKIDFTTIFKWRHRISQVCYFSVR